jgi:hypothetical protein
MNFNLSVVTMNESVIKMRLGFEGFVN